VFRSQSPYLASSIAHGSSEFRFLLYFDTAMASVLILAMIIPRTIGLCKTCFQDVDRVPRAQITQPLSHVASWMTYALFYFTIPLGSYFFYHHGQVGTSTRL
jgi:hypothetical protein